jgi:hypothetical protein
MKCRKIKEFRKDLKNKNNMEIMENIEKYIEEAEKDEKEKYSKRIEKLKLRQRAAEIINETQAQKKQNKPTKAEENHKTGSRQNTNAQIKPTKAEENHNTGSRQYTNAKIKLPTKAEENHNTGSRQQPSANKLPTTKFTTSDKIKVPKIDFRYLARKQLQELQNTYSENTIQENLYIDSDEMENIIQNLSKKVIIKNYSETILSATQHYKKQLALFDLGLQQIRKEFQAELKRQRTLKKFNFSTLRKLKIDVKETKKQFTTENRKYKWDILGIFGNNKTTNHEQMSIYLQTQLKNEINLKNQAIQTLKQRVKELENKRKENKEYNWDTDEDELQSKKARIAKMELEVMKQQKQIARKDNNNVLVSNIDTKIAETVKKLRLQKEKQQRGEYDEYD